MDTERLNQGRRKWLWLLNHTVILQTVYVHIKGKFNASPDSIFNVYGGAKLIIGSVITTAWALECRQRPFGTSSSHWPKGWQEEPCC